MTARVHYRERQRLRAADLAAEQEYRLGMRRRHNIAHHTWGIVVGLALEYTNALLIQPGLAVDGYGRELIVSEPLLVSPETLDAVRGDLGNVTGLDVWLVYAYIASSQPGCAGRWREGAALRLTPADATSDHRWPAEVSEADVDFVPWQPMPDDPARLWPVYLGTLDYDGQTSAYTLTQFDRPYAALVGSRVAAPSGLTWMDIFEGGSSGFRRFSVGLTDAAGKSVEALAVETQGNRTNAILRGDVNLDSAELEHKMVDQDFAGTLHFAEPLELPKAALPWNVYRTVAPVEGQPPLNQLRFEMFNPGGQGDPSKYELVVGTPSSDCLVIQADCSIRLNGDLQANGTIVQTPIPADPDDPRLTDEILKRWIAGLASGGSIVDTLYGGGANSPSDLRVAISGLPAKQDPGRALHYSATVTNAGSNVLADIRVRELVTIPGVAGARQGEIGLVPLLAGGQQSQPFAAPDIIAPAQGLLLVAITVTGVAPGGRVVSAVAIGATSIEIQIN